MAASTGPISPSSLNFGARHRSKLRLLSNLQIQKSHLPRVKQLIQLIFRVLGIGNSLLGSINQIQGILKKDESRFNRNDFELIDTKWSISFITRPPTFLRI